MTEQSTWYMLAAASSIVAVGIVAFFVYSLLRSWEHR